MTMIHVRYSPCRTRCSVTVALSLRGMPLRRIQPIFKCVAVEPGGFIDGESEIIADLRTRDALGLVLVKPRRPFAGEVRPGGGRHLREHGNDGHRYRQCRQPWQPAAASGFEQKTWKPGAVAHAGS